MKKSISFLLALLLLNSAFSQLVQPQSVSTDLLVTPSYLESPEKWALESFGELDQSAEEVSLRDQNAKHFKNSDGTFTAIIAAGNFHYWENNRWKTIFHSIVPTTNGFENLSNSHKTYFPSSASGSIKTMLQNGSELKDMLNMKMYFEVNGQSSNVQSIGSSAGIVNFNTLTYSNVYGPGIDLRLTQNTTKRKMDYLIGSLSALGSIPSQANYLVFEEKVELPTGWSYNLEQNQIFILDQNGSVQVVFEKPMFKDAPHSDAHGHMRSDELEGEYVVQQTGITLTILTKVQLSWLTDSARNFPVVIDPTINLYPNNIATWTGTNLAYHTNSSSAADAPLYSASTYSSQYTDYINVGRENSNYSYQSWSKFNISSLPDACVNAVNLNYRVSYNYSNASDCFATARLRHLANDPVPATGAARLTDIRDGDIFETREFRCFTTGSGWVNAPLTANLNQLVSAIPSGWFGVGFNTFQGGSHTTCFTEIYGHSSADRPFLAVNYTPYYQVQFSTPTPTNICAGQTQNISVTVTNAGCMPWTSGWTPPSSVNFSWWGSWQAGGLAGGQDNNPRLTPFAALAPGASQVVTFSVTVPATPGSYSIQTDLVRDAVCWFRGNGAPSCGPGNIDYIIPITVTAAPTVGAGVDQTICASQPTVLTGVVQSPTIQSVLDAINANQAPLIASVPTPYSYSLDMGVNATYISDGCSDMYDGGNYLNTNLATTIAYSNNVVTNNAGAFGAGGKYFTRFIGTGACNNSSASLFYWVADINGLSSVSITGNNGADGSGTQDLNTFTVTANGVTYSCFLKRVFGAGDPSINQLFMIPQPNSVTQSMGASTDNTLHTLTGLSGATRMYYMLYAGNAGAAISVAQATSIAQTFANIIPVENYSWTSNPPGFTSSIASPTVSPSVTTTYTLATTLYGCTSTDQVTLTIGTASLAPTSVSASHATHPNYCHGNTIGLSSVGGTPAGAGVVDVWYENSCTTTIDETWATTPVGRPGWWTSSATVNAANGILTVSSTSVDPMIYMGGLAINPAIYRYVQVRYRYVSGPATTGMQVFFENGSGLAEARSQRGTMILDGAWHFLNLDMSLNYSNVNSGWTAGPTVTGLRFDFCENTGMVMEFDFFLVSENRMVSDQTTLSLTPSNPYYPVVSTNYFTKKIDNCGTTTCASTNVILPPIGTTLSQDNENATCYVNANETIRYYHSSGRYIASVTSAGTTLGSTIATSYVEPSYLIVPACTMPSLDIAVMQRHWVITPTTNGSATVRLPYYTSELANLGTGSVASTSPYDLIVSPTNSNVYLSKYSGGAFPSSTNVNDNPFDNCAVGGTTLHANSGIGSINPVPVFNAMYSDFSITGFSEFWLHGASNNSPLPVTLSSFVATCNEAGEEVKVQWTTASEQNSLTFDVERSLDGEAWSLLGTLPAAGNSSSSLSYEMNDLDVRGHAIIYYRLNQIDQNGNSKQYDPTSIQCSSDEIGFEIFPNPSGMEVNVLLHGDYTDGTPLIFTDINGKEVLNLQYNAQSGKLMKVDLRNLNPGVYFVKLMDMEHPQVLRLIKQ